MDERLGGRRSGARVGWLVDGGEMGERIRALDWSATPLGPVQRWPQRLRTMVRLCLACKFASALFWGAQRIQIYNDRYRLILGGKHPRALGQPAAQCWAETWSIAGPIMARVFERGEAVWFEAEQFCVERDGYCEEAYFTSCYTPVADVAGAVCGIFETVVEVTSQVLAHRRLSVLRDLGVDTAAIRGARAVCTAAAATLARHPRDIPFALLYLWDPASGVATLAGQAGGGPDLPARFGAVALAADDPWQFDEVLASGTPVVLRDLAARVGEVSGAAWPEPVHVAVVLPVDRVGGEAPFGFMVAGVSPRRALDEDYLDFLRIAAQHLSRCLASADAYEFECRRGEALAQLDRAKTVHLSNVSHEFRTPLTLMLGPLEEVLKDPTRTLSAVDRQRIDTAHRNAQRLLKLVNSLLDFVRLEAGRMEASYVPIDLAAFTGELAGMFDSAFASAGVGLTIDCPPLPEAVYVDPDMWEKIVLNLLSNALKFTLAGNVTVRLRWRDGKAVLAVADTGVGVPSEHLPHLFERFHRVPDAPGRTREGSGIGLALVHELVALHGGTIRVDSVVGRGSAFTVAIPGGASHLPAQRIGAVSRHPAVSAQAPAFIGEALQWLPDAGAAQEPAGAPGSDAGARRARILVVDDNADMRRYITALLVPHWDVEAAVDGLQALEAAWRTPPDLVLTDLVMPNLDGFGLLHALRGDERTRATPVIVLSARAGEEARVEGLNAGADDYLVKPFGARELVARIRTHLDIARLRHEAVTQAQHDALTGLPNRTLCYQFAERMLAAARRDRTRVAVLFIDMDRFKPINDTYGHAVGDAVLREVARRLKLCVRSEDVVGRLGGDEFIAVLAHLRAASDAAHAAQHLIESLGRGYRVGERELFSSPSIGISLFPDDGRDVDTLLKNADAAMYHAKERGRNNFQFYASEFNERAATALRRERRLRDGLARGEFQLHYQPVVDVATHAVVAAEALLRWPATGIGPGEVIPLAEACGVIERMGAWVVGEACRQLREWRDSGLPPLTVAINVSPMQLRGPGLREAISRALDAHGVAAGTVQLELNEAVLLNNDDEAIAAVRGIRDAGLRIALDDFGTGRVGLRDLGRMPLDTVKIDQRFVASFAADRVSAAITGAIVAIGRTLGLQVVAEGIDSAESQALLHASGCRHMQGNYLCPPLPAHEFERWYRRRPH